MSTKPERTNRDAELPREDAESKATVTAVAWEPHQGLGRADWLYHGRRLGAIGRGVAWWIGDWVNYGNARFGEKYTQAARITGYDAQSLMNMAYVASRFDVSRRRAGLSWSHHAELAALDVDEQEMWLNHAEDNRLSVRGLRERLRARRSGREVPRAREPERIAHAANAVASRPVVCPKCGYHLDRAGTLRSARSA